MSPDPSATRFSISSSSAFFPLSLIRWGPVMGTPAPRPKGERCVSLPMPATAAAPEAQPMRASR